MRHLLLWLALATLATAPHAATTYTISRVYNAHGQLLQEQQADGTTRLYSYDANGNLQNHTDAQGRSQSYGYDALNRLEITSSPQFGSTRRRYDSLDQLTSITDPRGLTTRYQHNAFGELLSQTSPDSGTTSYTYGPDSQPLTRQDARQASQYQYDPQGRLTQRTDGSIVTQYQYGSSGSATNRLTHLSTGNVSLQWQYHPDGQVQTHSQTLGQHQFNTHYQHDSAGRLTQLRYPSGRLVHYRHDAQGRISSIHTQGNGDTDTQVVIDNVQYQPFGPARSWQYGNGHSYRRNYDQNGRINALTLGDILVTLGYEADRLGQQEWAGGLWQRLTSQQRVPAQPSRYQYGLSGPGGLARHSQGSATTTWQQDLNGNRV
ncbi:hypothetical protein, partial [Chitinimonas sp. JJ19]|uniref:hypothetical protein n=1 Tax=Chitinimonas sp. JJ19 TaxID=3109352 RepID=UPI00300252A1